MFEFVEESVERRSGALRRSLELGILTSKALRLGIALVQAGQPVHRTADEPQWVRGFQKATGTEQENNTTTPAEPATNLPPLVSTEAEVSPKSR